MTIQPPAPLHLSAENARGFAHVENWIFDLDNTLYPPEARIWPQIDDRITIWMAHRFGLDGLSARAWQKYLYHRHGTTLRGLMREYTIDPHEYLAFAHDIDYSTIAPDPSLGDAIAALPGRKLILTNGSRRHAEKVAMKLGILHHFEDIFDIVAADFRPKPEPRTYEIFLDKHAIDPTAAAMFEDIPRNLEAPYHLGMTAILVVPRQRDPFREIFEQDVVMASHIDYVTSDLAGFIESFCLPKDNRPMGKPENGASSFKVVT